VYWIHFKAGTLLDCRQLYTDKTVMDMSILQNDIFTKLSARSDISTCLHQTYKRIICVSVIGL